MPKISMLSFSLAVSERPRTCLTMLLRVLRWRSIKKLRRLSEISIKTKRPSASPAYLQWLVPASSAPSLVVQVSPWLWVREGKAGPILGPLMSHLASETNWTRKPQLMECASTRRTRYFLHPATWSKMQSLTKSSKGWTIWWRKLPSFSRSDSCRN